VPQALGDKGRHEGRDVAAHAGDLAHERGRDGADRRRGRQEDGLDPGRHGLVHGRHLHLVVEVGAVPDAPDQERGPVPAGGVHREVVEGRNLEGRALPGRERPADGPQHVGALVRREDRRLRGMHPDRDHEPVHQPDGVAHHVEMPVGHGVEGAGVEGGAGHERLGADPVGTVA
jgi:hypothetical protein